MIRELGKCPMCHTMIRLHKHGITLALVNGLMRLQKAGGGPLNIRELHMGRTVWDNFQKLRYWGLVAQVPNEEGKRKRGIWRVTRLGRQFLAGKKAINRFVWTDRGTKLMFDGPLIYIHEVKDVIWNRDDWEMDELDFLRP